MTTFYPLRVVLVVQLLLVHAPGMDCSMPGSSVLPEFAQIHVHWVGDAIEPSHLLPPPSTFAFNLSQHQSGWWVCFSNELALLIRWPKYWSFSFSISPFTEYLGLISFRIDWFDLLAVQGTLKSLLQHHSSKHHFFGAQLSLWSNFQYFYFLYVQSWINLLISVWWICQESLMVLTYELLCVLVTQLCPTLCDHMDWDLPVFSIHGIFQARRLEWVAISFSRGSSWPRNQT